MQHWALGAILVLAGCAAGPALQTGPDAEVTYDGLTRVDHTNLDVVWLKDDIDLSRYTKLRLQGTGIQYRADTASVQPSDEFPMSQEAKERFRQIVRDAFVESLSDSDRFELVTEPGPDVLYVRGAVLDVVSMVPPARTDGSATEVYVDRIGEATLLIELHDSQSDQILGRAVDRDAAEDMAGQLTRTNTATTWSEVRLMAQRWARSLREGLEELAEAGVVASTGSAPASVP